MTLNDYYFLIPVLTTVIVMPFAAWIWRMQGRVQRIETKLAYAEKEIARTVSENSKIFEKLNRIAEDVSAIKARLNHK